MTRSALRSAVFFDQDGTLIEDVGYIRNPADVVLLRDAIPAVRRVNHANWLAVVVTNQSGVARGLLSEEDVAHVRLEITRLLSLGGAHIDAWYHCPHHPDFSGACECRKPGTELFQRASADHGIDLRTSAFIGDRWRDVAPARRLGGRGILVSNEKTAQEDEALALHDAELAGTLLEAVDRVLTEADTTRHQPAAHASPLRLAVLASGNGSNLQAILDYFGTLGAHSPVAVVLVVSDRADAGALERARRAGIATAHITQPDDGEALSSLLVSHRVDLIALAGYLKRVPTSVTDRWRGAIVNIHPALLPQFGGSGMYGRRVHQAVLAAGVAESGASVHFVDEQYDHGAVIAQERVRVERDDTDASLAARVLEAEHRLYPRTLHELALSPSVLRRT